jgi:hypothetical protein
MKSNLAAKQGKFTASVGVAEFGSDKFYVNGGKLFYRACLVVTEHRITILANSAAILPRFIEI